MLSQRILADTREQNETATLHTLHSMVECAPLILLTLAIFTAGARKAHHVIYRKYHHAVRREAAF